MHALKLHTGQYLDLGENPTLTLNESNPVFDPQRINRSWSYPLSVPRNAKNVMALGGAGRIDAVLSQSKVVATLYLEGAVYDTGVLLVTGATDNTISLTFQNQSIDLATELERVNLRDLQLTEQIAEPFTPILYLVARRDSPIGAYDVLLVIAGVRYVASFTEPQQLVDQVNADYPGLLELTSSTSQEHYYTCRPTPEHGPLRLELTLLVEYDEATETTTTSLSLDDVNYQSESDRINAAFRALDTEAEDSAYRLPTIHAPSFYDAKNPDWGGIMNRYDPATSYYTNSDAPEQDRGGWADAILPQPRVAILLEKALDAIGYQLAGSLITDAELRELLLYNNHDLTIFLRDLGPDMSSELQIGEGIFFDLLQWIVPRPTFNLANHAPELTGLSLLLLFAETFAHVILVEPGSVKVTPINELLSAAPIDYTGKIEPDYKASYSQPKGITLDYNRQGDENIYPGQLERQQIGTGNETNDYSTPVFSTHETVRDLHVAGESYRVRIPTIDEVGRNQYYDVGNAPNLRFFFHRGLQPAGPGSSTPGDYPQAGHSRTSYGPGPVGKYSMNWQEDGGLYPTWWRRYIRLLQHGRSDSRKVRLTVADLLQLRTWRNARVSYRTPQGTAVAIIRNVRVRSTAAGLEVATVTFQLEPS